MSNEPRFGRPGMRYLREWREYIGLSQEALARKAGVSTSTISRSERHAVHEPQLDVVRKIEEALGREPFGLEVPPPGVPDMNTRDLLALVSALHTIADAADGSLSANLQIEDEDEVGAAFVRWVAAQPLHVNRGWPLELPGPFSLRSAVWLLGEIADALEEAGAEHQKVH